MQEDSQNHSFVVKIWLDFDEDAKPNRQLRGRVTHAFTKEFSPVRAPADIISFIKPYLSNMDARMSIRNRIILWLCS